MSASVLVVDDEETARMVVSEFLRSKGYEVLEQVPWLMPARSSTRTAPTLSSWM